MAASDDLQRVELQVLHRAHGLFRALEAAPPPPGHRPCWRTTWGYTPRVALWIGLADDEDRVGGLVGIEPVRGAEGGRVGKRRVAREELVRDSQRVEPLGQGVPRRIVGHSPKDTDRAVSGRRGVPCLRVRGSGLRYGMPGSGTGAGAFAGDSLPVGIEPAVEFRLLAGRDVDHREILVKIADDLGAVR